MVSGRWRRGISGAVTLIAPLSADPLQSLERDPAPVETLTLGVEEEFFVVDRSSGLLSLRSPEYVDLAGRTIGGSVSPEINLCQIEVDTDVCHTLDQVGEDLARLRRALGDAGRQIGCAPAAVGTHPVSSWQDQRVNHHLERYVEMEDVYQIVARQQVICGCHVHVGIDDPEIGIEIMNRSRPWLPALLALSANSPYWHGLDTGFASYRMQVWQRWPTAGMPPLLGSRREYDALIDELVQTGTIEDPTYLYWYVRPSARHATVEFRVCDVCLDLEDTIAIAGLVRALAWTCARDARDGAPVPGRSREAMEAAMWRAARYGLSGELVDAVDPIARPAAEVVRQLVAHVRDGLDEHGDRELVEELVERVLRRGNGAQRQRARLERASGDRQALLDFIVEQTYPRAELS